jgi:hypothetical protein
LTAMPRWLPGSLLMAADYTTWTVIHLSACAVPPESEVTSAVA